MAKGAANAAKNLEGIEQGNAKGYQDTANSIQGQLSPFLENELNNPQGYGQQELEQQQTAGGQANSGATGAAGEAANLAASRTGNPAATSSIIDAVSRNAMQQQSNNVLNIANNNALMKQQQQQAGVSGLGTLYGEDTNAALQSLGLGNTSVGQWTNADKETNQAMMNDISAAGKIAGGVASGVVGGI